MNTNFKKNIPNILTSMRIIGTFVMIFTPTLSAGFYASYTFAGVTDVLDGYVARKTNCTSEFGAKLDSVADLFLYTSAMFKILPILIMSLPAYLMYLSYTIFGFRICLYIYEGIKRHVFMSNHTMLNKLTGVLVFIVPYFIKTGPFFTGLAYVIGTIALISLIYEIVFMRRSNKES